jgi:vacuolar-type H+-ATPase subunit F/Vma7
MAHRVHVLCRPEVTPGFALAGLQASAAIGGADAAEVLRALATDPTVGVVLLQDDLLRELPAGTMTALERRPLPVVVPFPGPKVGTSEAGPEAYIVELLQQAVGYRVRLR